MTITISAEFEAKIRERANAEGISVDAYIERLIQEDGNWAEHFEEPASESDAELADIRAAVTEGIEQAERGEARPAEQVFAEFRTRHDIPD